MLGHIPNPRYATRSVLLAVSILILLGSAGTSKASVYYSLIIESQATVSSPEVILQNGTAGTSTIYTNNTSAKVEVAAAGDWWNANYSYRRRITITNNNATVSIPAKFTINFTIDTQQMVTDGKLQADGDDCRIVWWNSSSSSWLELDRLNTTNFNTTSTTMKFRTQTNIPGGNSDHNYFAYYGNTAATNPPSNGSNVYFFEDLFNRAISSTVGFGWTEQESGTADAQIASNPLVSTNVLDLYGADLSMDCIALHSLSGIDDTGRWVWEFGFVWDRDSSEASYEVYMQLGNSSMTQSSPWTGVGVFVSWTGTGIDTTIANAASTHEMLRVFDDDQTPTEVEVVSGGADIKLDVDYSTGDFKLYRDETLKGTYNFYQTILTYDTMRFVSDRISPSAVVKRGMDYTRLYLTLAPNPTVSLGSEGKKMEDYVDSDLSDVDDSADKGTHSNFSAQQYGPDSIYDNLTEESTHILELWVNEFTNLENDWAEVGASPYLDAIDYATNYIWVLSTDLDYESQFDFANSSNLGTINDVKVCLYAMNEAGGDDEIEVYLYNSTGGPYSIVQFAPTAGSWGWYNYSCLSTLPTWTEVNNGQLRVRAEKITGGNDVYVDGALLLINYTSIAVKSWGITDASTFTTSSSHTTYRYMGGTSPDVDNMKVTELHLYYSGTGTTAIALYTGGALDDPTGATKRTEAYNVSVVAGWNEIDVPDYDWEKNTVTWVGVCHEGGYTLYSSNSADAGDFQSERGRYRQDNPADGNETGPMPTNPGSPGQWNSYWMAVHVEYEAPNYELDLEVKWTNVDFDETNEYLCIYGGTMGSENITFNVWNGTAWQELLINLTSGWNNVSVASYLTSSDFTIRFKGTQESNDTVQDSWDIDATLLHVWTFVETTYDYVLRAKNTVTNSWEIRLKQYSNSSIGRLQNCTIYFHNSTDGTSSQIVIENGAFVNETGAWYDLGSLETIYIAMTVEANSTGTSYVRTYLEIRIPDTTTYLQYKITFEIT